MKPITSVITNLLILEIWTDFGFLELNVDLQKVILHFENYLCDIASNKQIETLESYDMNEKSIVDYTNRHNKT